ncbi:uncharacterized protein O3C94_009295 [Discoglossus pictus]
MELDHFLHQGDLRTVLLFPPVSSRLRYLIHRLTESHTTLSSFSVGEGWQRRTVICHAGIRLPDQEKDSKNAREQKHERYRGGGFNFFKGGGRGRPGGRQRNYGRPDKALYVPRGKYSRREQAEGKNPEDVRSGGELEERNHRGVSAKEKNRRELEEGVNRGGEFEEVREMVEFEESKRNERPTEGEKGGDLEGVVRDKFQGDNIAVLDGGENKERFEEGEEETGAVEEEQHKNALKEETTGSLEEEKNRGGLQEWEIKELVKGKDKKGGIDEERGGHDQQETRVESEEGLKTTGYEEGKNKGELSEREEPDGLNLEEKRECLEWNKNYEDRDGVKDRCEEDGQKGGLEEELSGHRTEQSEDGDQMSEIIEHGEINREETDEDLRSKASSNAFNKYLDTEHRGDLAETGPSASIQIDNMAQQECPTLPITDGTAGEISLRCERDSGTLEKGDVEERIGEGTTKPEDESAKSENNMSGNITEGNQNFLTKNMECESKDTTTRLETVDNSISDKDRKNETNAIRQEGESTANNKSHAAGDLEDVIAQILQEISAHVCEKDVHIQPLLGDYSGFTEIQTDQGRFGHIIEVYGFTSELRTDDLIEPFTEYRDRGFCLQWVDETHALGIFSSPEDAYTASCRKHPSMKFRPLSQGTRQSKLLAQERAEFFQPYKERPQTDKAVARRMVSRALGLPREEENHVKKE